MDYPLMFVVVLTFDDCKPNGSFPSIVGFVVANQATEYMQMSYEKRKYFEKKVVVVMLVLLVVM